MAANQVNIWTYTLDATDIEILPPDFQFTTISVLASGGTVTISGVGSNAQTGPSTPITLADGQSITINAGSNDTNIISYLYINASAFAYIVAR
jgi:hypothetical protein